MNVKRLEKKYDLVDCYPVIAKGKPEHGIWDMECADTVLVIHAKVKDNTALYMLNINCVGYYRKSIEEKEG